MSVAETLKEKAEGLASSVGDLNKLTVDKIEEAAGLNIASMSYFSNLCVKELRVLSNIRDVESVQKFTADSISISGELTKRMLDDSKAWLNLSVDFTKKAVGLLKGEGPPSAGRTDNDKKSPVKSVAS